MVGAVGVFVVAISGIALFGGAGGYATGVIDEINITIPSSCSLANTVGSAHTATIENGVYQENIGETTFKVFCNDSEGFSVYSVGYTNDEFGNNTLKPAVVDNSNAVATGTATSGSTSNWAMKLSAVSGTYAPTLETGFNDYHVIPDDYTKVASYSSNTDTTTGSSFKSTYSAFISQTQLADSYTGKVKYTVVHPSSELAPIEEIGQLTYMQDFKDLTAEQRTAVLNSMQYNTTYNLIDNRDNKTYQIARLKDDNIWMAENLDLGRTELTQDLTSQNTNLSETVAAETFNGWKVESGTESNIIGEYISLTTANSSSGLDIDSTTGTPFGTLYNFCVTSAGTICSSSNSDDAQYDICPAGWRLPTGESSGEFKTLYDLTDYNTVAKMRAPISDGGAAFALAGIFDSGAPDDQNSVGHYWSSSRYSNGIMSTVYLSNSSVSPYNTLGRDNGLSVRCIAKRPSRTLTISYSAGVSSVQVNGITIQNGGVVNLEEGTPYSVTVTTTEGYALSNWTSTSGFIGSNVSESTTYTIGFDNATLTAHAMLAIQKLDSSNCTITASQVVDNRDNHIYTIQRLADGRCWMMENLDLGRTTLTRDLTSANTNLTTTVTASVFNSWKKTSSTRTYDSGEFVPITSSNSTTGIDSDPISGTPYGTIYNYYAASAGTIAGSVNAKSSKYDICPSGWRLPTGGNSSEYWVLFNTTAYDTLEELRAPINENGAAFNLSGAFFDSIPKEQDEYGYYWSSSNVSNTDMYEFYVNAYRFGTISTDRGYGTAIRCILDETSISDLTYMQDFNSLTPAAKASVAKSMADNTVYNLIDNRDNKTYQIARLKDGNIWMAENMDLGRTTITTDLTSTNTNLDANANAVTVSEFNSWIKSSGTASYTTAELIPVSGTDSASNTPYGTLYNYCAASAGSICSASNANTVDATSDICPAGWRLPTGGNPGEFRFLYSLTDYNSSAKMRAPIASGGAAFTLAGYFINSVPAGQERFGDYWSSTKYSMMSMRLLGLEQSTVSLNNNSDRCNSYSVRCIVK